MLLNWWIGLYYIMSKKKKSSKSDKDQRKELESTLLAILDQGQGKGYSLKQLIKKLSLKKKDDIKLLGQILDSQVEADRIQELSNGSYKSNRKEEELIGIVDHVSSR